jgi:hypothetical protein
MADLTPFRIDRETLRILKADAARLASLIGDIASRCEAAPPDTPPLTAELVRSVIRARRLRERFFEQNLFADPAWDMLLDLMAARLEGKRVPVSSLCVAAAVPPTTALRWIDLLSDQGLFVRVVDPKLRRRVFVELSAGAAAAMEACLTAARSASPLFI